MDYTSDLSLYKAKMKKIKEFCNTFKILSRNLPGSHRPTKRKKVKTLVTFHKKKIRKKEI